MTIEDIEQQYFEAMKHEAIDYREACRQWNLVVKKMKEEKKSLESQLRAADELAKAAKNLHQSDTTEEFDKSLAAYEKAREQ